MIIIKMLQEETNMLKVFDQILVFLERVFGRLWRGATTGQI
jgi:hypothetical protein